MATTTASDRNEAVRMIEEGLGPDGSDELANAVFGVCLARGYITFRDSHYVIAIPDWNDGGEGWNDVLRAAEADLRAEADLMTYNCSDAYGAVIEIEAATSLDAAREYVETGCYEPEKRTVWITVRCWIGDDRDSSERHKITVEPIEPGCTEDEHDWGNESVYGSGGGVCITESCRHCGVERVIDTWAQDPEDGEQGLKSVTYREPAFDD